MITKINDYNDLLNKISEFKRNTSSKLTNFFPNKALHENWIKQNNFYYKEENNLLFIFHEKESHYETFYIAEDLNSVIRQLKILKKSFQKPFVLEHVYKERKDLPISLPTAKLKKMVKKISSLAEEPNNDIDKASLSDIPILTNIFTNYFNRFTERIPDEDELKNLIQSESVSVIRTEDSIKGFIIYEVKGKSSHLRYWWINPRYRNQGIGSKLIKDFFKASKNCLMLYLWVFSDNEDAINKYLHYGFDFDGMTDDIYLI